jgi:hypothetical protein
MSGVENSRSGFGHFWLQLAAVIISVIALLTSGFGAYRAYKAQEQANHIAQENARIAQENVQLQKQNVEFQKQLQAQSQAAAVRSSAQQVVLTTSPAEIPFGRSAQGVTIDNGTYKKITNITLFFTTGAKNAIVDYSNYSSLAPCSYLTLSFTSSFSLPYYWDAWIYFTDADGNIWLTDLNGHFSKATQVPSGGQSVSSELNISSGVPGFCGQ